MDFTAFPLRVGTVAEAEVAGPALRLVVDLGGDRRTTTAHITERYGPEDVVGRQVVVVLDPPGSAPGNEIVVLAAVSPEHGAVLLRPEEPVPDGTAVV